MPRTRPITRPPGGATPWLLATLLGLVGWAHESTPIAQPMQHWLQDRAVADARPMASTGVAMVLIDEASQARHGPLPWRRDLHARLIDQLSGARVVIDTEPFGTPESERALAELQNIHATIAADPARADDLHVRAAHPRQNGFQLALDRVAARLAFPAEIAGAVVADNEFEIFHACDSKSFVYRQAG